MENLTSVFKGITQIDLFLVALIMVLTWLLLRLLHWLLPQLAARAPGRFRLYLLPLMPILQIVVVVGAIINIVPLLIDPTSENLLAVSGAVAIAFGFAFQDYASSFIASIVAIYERPYRIGDWVKIGDAYGEVTSLGFRAIEMVTPDDTVVTIPHKKLWNSIIYNDNNGHREHQCVADFFLHAEHDAEKVKQKLYDVALTSPYLQLNRPIAVIVLEKPWGTHYRLKAYPIDGRDQFRFTTDLTVRGKASLAKLGVKPANTAVAATLGMNHSGEQILK